MDNTVAKNIVQKLGQATNPEVQQPGMLTSTLTGALKSLDAYVKMASQQDQNDPDLSLVRKIISALSMLVIKDQQEGQGAGEQGESQSPDQGGIGGPEMGQGSIMGGMGGGDMMSGAPSMPDLSSIVGQ